MSYAALGDESTQKARSQWPSLVQSLTPRGAISGDHGLSRPSLPPVLVWVAPEADPAPSTGGQTIYRKYRNSGSRGGW